MYVGIDLGGTNIVGALVNENGQIIEEKNCETNVERSAEEIIGDIKKIIIDLMDKSKEKIKAIGIGIPGFADKDGNIIRCINLKWRNIPLKVILEKDLKVPVFLDNDATVAALAEYEFGAMKGTDNAVMLTLGTGIGAGIIINGRVYSGSHGIGSEIGHMVVGENFYDCNCGRNGCVETFASSSAIIRYTEKLIKEGRKSIIYEKINGNFKGLNAKIIFQCAKEGDKVANLSLHRFVKYLSIGIINIINILDPEIIALGGGVSKSGDFLLSLLKQETYENYDKKLLMPKIVLAKLGNKAGLVGAAMIGKQGINCK